MPRRIRPTFPKESHAPKRPKPLDDLGPGHRRGDGHQETSQANLDSLQEDYVRKYDYKPDRSNGDAQIAYKNDPRTAHGLKTPRTHGNITKSLIQLRERSRQGPA